jgi:hypothetical protein
MAFVISEDAVDSVSTNLCCIFPAQALDGEVIEAKKVFFEQGNKENAQPVKFYKNASKCSDVGCNRTPVPAPTDTPPGPCAGPLVAPLKRVLVCTKNRSVYINNILFAVQGDVTKGLGTDRPIVGPFKYPTINIANTV